MPFIVYGFMKVGEIALRPPGPLLIENILMKSKTNVEHCLSCPNQSLASQLADIFCPAQLA